MVKLQESSQIMVLVDENGNVFTCSTAQFVGHEKTYQPVSANQVRVWTPTTQYVSDGENQSRDIFYTPERFTLYVSKIMTYQAFVDAANAPQSPTFADQQTAALTNWNQQVNAFISQYYDTGTQISFIKIYLQNEAARPLIEQVDAWVSAVMAYYYTIKAALQAASNTTELATVHAEQQEFDVRFGPTGSIQAVPNVHLAQFF